MSRYTMPFSNRQQADNFAKKVKGKVVEVEDRPKWFIVEYES